MSGTQFLPRAHSHPFMPGIISITDTWDSTQDWPALAQMNWRKLAFTSLLKWGHTTVKFHDWQELAQAPPTAVVLCDSAARTHSKLFTYLFIYFIYVYFFPMLWIGSQRSGFFSSSLLVRKSSQISLNNGGAGWPKGSQPWRHGHGQRCTGSSSRDSCDVCAARLCSASLAVPRDQSWSSGRIASHLHAIYHWEVPLSSYGCGEYCS